MKTMFQTGRYLNALANHQAARKARKKKRQIEALRKFGKPPKYEPGMGNAFYLTREWRTLRWEVLSTSDGKCVMCGATKKSSGKSMHVDHIHPRSAFPHLELSKSNLQVLCEDCNIGKGKSVWKPTDARFKRSPSPRALNPGVPNSIETERQQTEG